MPNQVSPSNQDPNPQPSLLSLLPPSLNNLLKYKKIVGYILLAGAVVFGAYYIKDRFHNKILAGQEKVIADLQQQYAKLKAEKEVADKKVAEAEFSYNNEKMLTDTLRKKLDAKIHKDQPAETAEQADQVQQKIETHTNFNMDELTPLDACRAENTQLVKTLTEADITIEALKVDKTATEALLNNANTQVIDLDKLNEDLKKDLGTETHRKKLWRETAAGEALVIVTIVLIHLL